MILWILIFLSISVVTTQPIDRNNRVGAFYYLLDFGYIAKDENTETAALMSDDVITKAIKDFQVSFAQRLSKKTTEFWVEKKINYICRIKICFFYVLSKKEVKTEFEFSRQN